MPHSRVPELLELSPPGTPPSSVPVLTPHSVWLSTGKRWGHQTSSGFGGGGGVTTDSAAVVNPQGLSVPTG